MPAENQHIHIQQGDSQKVNVPILNQQDGLKSLNLAGSEVIWELYQEPYHKLLISKSSRVETEIRIVSTSEGIAQILISEADTSGLKVGAKYSHYLRVKDTFGQKSTVTKGTLFIEN
jgi:hypothetical protein